MVDLTYRDQRGEMDSGNPSPLSVIADVAKSAACNIYFKSPAAFLSDRLPGTPLLDGQRAFFDELCDDKGDLPPPPVPPFEGGQCCAPYNVVITGNLMVSNGNMIPYTTQTNIVGKFVRFYVDTRPGNPGKTVTSVRFDYLGGAGCTTLTTNVRRSTEYPFQDGTTGYYTIEDITITRTDGQPDNCGSPPAVYPDGDLTVNDFDFSVNVNFSPTFQIPVSVSVIPTIVNVVNVFRPELNIKVGDINVNFSLGGITFAPTINLTPGSRLPNVDPRPLPPPPKTNNPPLPQKDYTPQLDDIKRRIDDLQEEVEECCDREAPPPPPPPGKVAISVLANADSGTFSLPPNTFKVTVDITERPTQEKVQFGNNGSDVIYAGWAWFASGLAMGERMPVDANGKVYAPPPRIGESFVFTLYKGYRAIIRAYYIV